jgi:hypothetical protein
VQVVARLRAERRTGVLFSATQLTNVLVPYPNMNADPRRPSSSQVNGTGLPELLRKEDVASFLLVSTRTVERLLAAGEFAGGVMRANGIVRITRSALEEFLERSFEVK